MSRFTRLASASGGTSGGSHTDHCKYEWELIANCCCWKCCYSGSQLDIQVDPSSFSAFKVVMNGMATNCSSSTNVWVLPKYHIADGTYCNWWCCNSYSWVRPGGINGCNGVMICHCYCTSGCHPSLFSCCANCVPNKLVGCIMSGNAANNAYGIHGEMCLSQGCNQNARLNLAYMKNCWTKSVSSTGGCWECADVVSVYSGLGFVGPRWNAGETCGWGAQIPNWQVYGIRCQKDIASTLL